MRYFFLTLIIAPSLALFVSNKNVMDFLKVILPAFNLEAFYRFPKSNRIFLTPRLLVIFNPEQNNDNHTIYVGTIRTTFSF